MVPKKPDIDETLPRLRTGIEGLDSILLGGFPAGRMYLFEGSPGCGKTTLALQILVAGARRGLRGLYVTLSETEEELREVARGHDLLLSDIEIFDLQSAEQDVNSEQQYTLFHPAEVELTETTAEVLRAVERNDPQIVVFDSLSEMRLLARDSLRYRRQILALKHYFSRRGCTIFLLDTSTEHDDGFQIASIAHGVLHLEQNAPRYGGQTRRMRFSKVRSIRYREGWHDYTIDTGGVEVFPRLEASEHHFDFQRECISSGVPRLDALLGGGADRGSSLLLLGASGTGKSTIAMQYMRAAAARREVSCAYLFDETLQAWKARGRALEMGFDDREEFVRTRQVNAAELTPGQFAHLVRTDVEQSNARIIVIDTVNGYELAMPEARSLSLHLHELLSYLSTRGVLTILTAVQHGIVGQNVESPVELSYFADSVLLLRYFEAYGEVRQALSVIKKRSGNHERQLRELSVRAPEGIFVGETLRDFLGVLAGNPTYAGARPELLDK